MVLKLCDQHCVCVCMCVCMCACGVFWGVCVREIFSLTCSCVCDLFACVDTKGTLVYGLI